MSKYKFSLVKNEKCKVCDVDALTIMYNDEGLWTSLLENHKRSAYLKLFNSQEINFDFIQDLKICKGLNLSYNNKS